MLERALELAERGRGTTHPNPVVGAVVVREGEVVGEGWHERKGGPHAEVVALAVARERARGATLFVTMEPCAHHGWTPPCTEAVLAAGVTKVVAGSLDPNPEAAGGFEVLRTAGVGVEDAGSFAARAQNEAWRTWVSERRPFVILKLAQTLDGRVAVPGSRWISGEESRRRVHELRAQVDTVAVGMGTVRAARARRASASPRGPARARALPSRAAPTRGTRSRAPSPGRPPVGRRRRAATVAGPPLHGASRSPPRRSGSGRRRRRSPAPGT